MGAGKATLKELETYYSVEDLYLMIEVAAVDSYNAYLAERYEAGRKQ